MLHISARMAWPIGLRGSFRLETRELSLSEAQKLILATNQIEHDIHFRDERRFLQTLGMPIGPEMRVWKGDCPMLLFGYRHILDEEMDFEDPEVIGFIKPFFQLVTVMSPCEN